jgi:hypothetical protein
LGICNVEKMNRNINGYKPMYLVSGFKMFHWLVLHECPTCNEKLEPRDPRERGEMGRSSGGRNPYRTYDGLEQPFIGS